MRILIDLQGAQSESKLRGIGRYTLSLVKAIARNSNGHQIELLLCDGLPDTIVPIRQMFKGIIKSENIHVFSIVKPVSTFNSTNLNVIKIAEIIREQAIEKLNPDILYICSLFEGWIDNVVTSIHNLSHNTLTVATLYDLIPLMNPKENILSNYHNKWYLNKLENLKKADLILSISNFSKQEAVEKLQLDPNSIINISSAADETFHCLDSNEKLPSKFNISKPFILSTGNLEPHKNTLGLLKAFALLPSDIRQKYQFVIICNTLGSNLKRFKSFISKAGLNYEKEVILTGHVSNEELILLYNRCELFVLASKQEGFGLPALEAMKCGAITIGSNRTSIPEVIGNENALFDPYNSEKIADKIFQCLSNPKLKEQLKDQQKNQVKKFSWDESAKIAIHAFEQLYQQKKISKTNSDNSYKKLLADVTQIYKNFPPNDYYLQSVANCIAINNYARNEKYFFVDISALVERDDKSGIQRVVRSVLSEFLSFPPEGFIVKPIYGTNEGIFRYANSFLKKLPSKDLNEDTPIESRPGDIFFGLDLSAHLFPVFEPVLRDFRNNGVNIFYVIYDIIPILYPHWCGQGMPEVFYEWLKNITNYADGLFCISNAVADEVRAWVKVNPPKRKDPLYIDFFHIGADIQNSLPSKGIPDNANVVLDLLKKNHSFLIVSTIEPRKGHAHALKAFEKLWKENSDAILVIVGKLGWKMEEFAKTLENHPEINKKLFWLKGTSDEYLLKVYESVSALISPSEAEGFGLPLIEAAKYSIPIIARDIPVFREIVGENALYFKGGDPIHLSNSVKKWIELKSQNQVPDSSKITWLTWKQSAQRLIQLFKQYQY